MPAQKIAHFRGKDKISGFQPVFRHIHPFAGVAGFYDSYDAVDYVIGDIPDLAEAHLDVGSTLGIKSIRLVLNYQGDPDFTDLGTTIHFDHTWNHDEFTMVDLNSNQRRFVGFPIIGLKQRADVVNGFGNTFMQDFHHHDERAPVTFFGDTTGNFSDAGGVRIVTFAPEDPSIISSSAPPNPPPTDGFDPRSYWQLKRYVDAIATVIQVYDPEAADGNGNVLPILNVRVSPVDFMADPDVFVVNGSAIHGWGETQGGPSGDANWDFALTFSRV